MSHTIDRIALVPRWGGTAASDWIEWLADLRPEPVVVAPLRPTPDAPQVQPSSRSVLEVLGDDPALRARTLVVAHSVGCQAALHALAALPGGQGVAALLCVAGWWTVDEPWDTIRPWLEAPLDAARVRDAVGAVRVLLSDDDPFTADWPRTQALFRDRLGAEVQVVRGARHFNAAQEPAVAEAVAALCGQSQAGSAGHPPQRR